MTQALRRGPRDAFGGPRAARLADAPFVAADDELCGPAVLAMLLGAAGRPAEVATLTREVYLPGRRGTLQAEMLAGARRHGAVAFELPPRLDAVLSEVADGSPVGVLLNLALPWWPRWHYAVLVGYDLDRGTARLHSGREAAAEWPLATLEHTWARSGHWAFVARPPGALPRTVEPEAALRALVGFDRVAAPLDAAIAWRPAASRWPDRLPLVLGEGNAWLAAGDAARAVHVLRTATARHDRAAVWNNLAQALAEAGDRPAAIAAADRAVQQAQASEPQWLDVVRRTRQELERAGGDVLRR